jgi:oligopeptide/dipeptide ABC transporter ATP-binding protein
MLLAVRNLAVEFDLGSTGCLRAVDGANLQIERGKILGLVGESGCGKTVFCLSLLRLVPRPGRIVDGQVWLEGTEILALSKKLMRTVRGAQIAMVFQNAQSALNPVFTIGQQLAAVLRLHGRFTRSETLDRAGDLLRRVQLFDTTRTLQAYPHQLSIGMCQRVAIAMALACRPKLLIADEPTASLDVTVQAQILELLRKLRDETGTSILIVSHDLGVTAQLCDRIAVMYLGRVVEVADARELYSSPLHPYTQALLDSVPLPDPDHRSKMATLRGETPNALDLPSGCRFRTRCPKAMEHCAVIDPELFDVGASQKSESRTHHVACLLYTSEAANVARTRAASEPNGTEGI